MLIKLGLLLSRSAPRLFRRAAPYPSREDKAVELTDALGRYVPAREAVSVPVPGGGRDGTATTCPQMRLRPSLL